ncbi:MAG: Uma2 family endonuclease [Anaerolineae bacterium]|nr:Uma2 family endonuclease [Anaerolineae bacterium]
MVTPDRVKVTAAEFFELPETMHLTELIEGYLFVTPAQVPRHQLLLADFFRLLHHLRPNGELFFAPLSVYLDDENIPQPDLLWVAADSKCIITDKRLEGPPDLIVEIFSPGTAKRDKSDKFKLYERFGVREYWMVDPVGQYVEVWVWTEGRYVQQGVYGAGDKFESPVLGNKSVDLTGIFEG